MRFKRGKGTSTEERGLTARRERESSMWIQNLLQTKACSKLWYVVPETFTKSILWNSVFEFTVTLLSSLALLLLPPFQIIRHINLIKHKKLWLSKIVRMSYNLERREYYTRNNPGNAWVWTKLVFFFFPKIKQDKDKYFSPQKMHELIFPTCGSRVKWKSQSSWS